jgi:hypothetical protein
VALVVALLLLVRVLLVVIGGLLAVLVTLVTKEVVARVARLVTMLMETHLLLGW